MTGSDVTSHQAVLRNKKDGRHPKTRVPANSQQQHFNSEQNGLGEVAHLLYRQPTTLLDAKRPRERAAFSSVLACQPPRGNVNPHAVSKGDYACHESFEARFQVLKRIFLTRPSFRVCHLFGMLVHVLQLRYYIHDFGSIE
jgi:hypothetical protein